MKEETILSRWVAFISSLILTIVAFWIIVQPDFFHLRVRGAIFCILVLAILQFIIQSLFFLNLWNEKRPRWNLIIFATTISIIITIVVGTIWIMNELNQRMM